MPKMKRIPLKWNQVIYVNGYPCKVAKCKRGGVNLWVDADCPIAGETNETVDVSAPTRESVPIDPQIQRKVCKILKERGFAAYQNYQEGTP